jgi:hypothetical protein
MAQTPARQQCFDVQSLAVIHALGVPTTIVALMPKKLQFW